MNSIFVAYSTRNPDEVIERYTKKTGFPPTVLLIRPDFVFSKDSPLFAKSRRAAWGVILASHRIKPSEIDDDTACGKFHDNSFDDGKFTLPPEVDFSFPVERKGRPRKEKAICPHCHGRILSFENLGFWYGWAFGITPPYWEELRQYIFRRDGYTCQSCHKKYPPALLQAHHVNGKEDGGEDGARNLRTLCYACHADSKPIFPEELDERVV
jgi:5-methylcytosine-specific restriction protein A